MYRLAPLCPECEYYQYCHKWGDFLPTINCGKIFNTLCDWSDENGEVTEKIFCSLLGIDNESGTHERTCLKCGETFFTSGKRLFCSLSCKMEYARQLRREASICQFCGLNTGKENTAFCSSECRKTFIEKFFGGTAKLENPEALLVFNSWLSSQLEEKGMSQNRLARELDVSPSTVFKWVAGVALPPRRNVILLSHIFDIDVMALESMIIDDEIVLMARGGSSDEEP